MIGHGAAAVVVFAAAWMTQGRESPYLGPLVVYLGYLNLTVALVNIAPGGGLDGETAWNLRALREVRRSREPRRR